GRDAPTDAAARAAAGSAQLPVTGPVLDARRKRNPQRRSSSLSRTPAPRRPIARRNRRRRRQRPRRRPRQGSPRNRRRPRAQPPSPEHDQPPAATLPPFT